MLNKLKKSVWLQKSIALNFALHAILALMLEKTLKRYSFWILKYQAQPPNRRPCFQLRKHLSQVLLG